MAVHSLKTVQRIPGNIEDVWSFFSNPTNLKAITPAQLRFHVISKHHGNLIYPGQIIEYTVSPVLGIPLYWMTEITHVTGKLYFIDEQRYGPYSMWHHQHHFKTIEGGIEMTDIVHYKIPFWILGEAAHALFIRKQLNDIFSFRYQKTAAVLGQWPGEQYSIDFY
ncbi:MAG: SRPBCC family protein [Chitinophagaceae bacterium]